MDTLINFEEGKHLNNLMMGKLYISIAHTTKKYLFRYNPIIKQVQSSEHTPFTFQYPIKQHNCIKYFKEAYDLIEDYDFMCVYVQIFLFIKN